MNRANNFNKFQTFEKQILNSQVDSISILFVFHFSACLYTE